MIFLVLTLFSFVYAQDEDMPPKETLTIQSFLSDMKAHPANYYAIINRTQPEIDYLTANSSLSEFLNYFNLEISTYFKDDGRNFVLIEIPNTYLGDLFGLQKSYSYIEVYEDALFDFQSYDYYYNTGWRKFNYTVLYAVPQDLAFARGINFSNEQSRKYADEEINKIDKDNDNLLNPSELAVYFFDKIAYRVMDYKNHPINTDYAVIDEDNNLKELQFGNRNFCFYFNFSNSIFTRYTYKVPSFNITEFCINKSIVSELTCNSGAVLYESIPCPSGYSCFDGACKTTGKYKGNFRETIFTLIMRWIIQGDISIDDVSSRVIRWVFS